MRPLSPRERRLVAVGVLVGAIGAGWLLVVGPIVGGFQARDDERQAILERHERNQRLLAGVSALRETRVQQRRSGAAFRITAPNPSMAAEALKQKLVTRLGEAGGTVTAAQEVKNDVPNGWVSVRADATMTLTQFNTCLRGIENEAPYVVIDYASINADEAFRTGRSGPLLIRLQISALHAVPASR
uniref:General secretion pathway protein M n=1 Tax=Caulobacter sp. (strain K31) TaxID=366602 RepID=B0T7N6_CAUSK